MARRTSNNVATAPAAIVADVENDSTDITTDVENDSTDITTDDSNDTDDNGTDYAAVIAAAVEADTLPVVLSDMSDDDVIAAWQAVNGGTRTRMRNALTAAAMSAMTGDSPSIIEAQRLAGLVTRCNALTTAARPSAVIDWDALVSGRVSDLLHAAAALHYGDVRPSGMPEDVALSAPVNLSDVLTDILTGEPVALTDGQRAIASQRVTRGGQTNDVVGFIIERVQAVAAEYAGGQVRVSDVTRNVDTTVSAGSIQQAWAALADVENDGRSARRLRAAGIGVVARRDAGMTAAQAQARNDAGDDVLHNVTDTGAAAFIVLPDVE